MRKKVQAVFLIILLSLSMLSACTGEEAATSADETTEAVTTQAEPATLAPTAPSETTPSETAPPETTPSETAPSETEPPVPVDPDTLMFTPETYPKVDGSTSTKPLAKSIQEEFTGAENVEIKHSKSHQSYLNVIDGLCDMILAVEPSPDEYAYAAEKGVTLDVQKVTNEGFVFFVNKRNPIDSLTLEQIRGIYSGKITNWKDVGGLDAEIVAFQRPRNSGSQTGMESLVMGDIPMMEPVTGTVADTMNEIVDVISAFDSGENAIGYPVIDGLSDGSVEEKINQVLREDAEALHAEEAFSETLNYKEETRTFYLPDGASDFAPFHIDRISVKELEGKTEQGAPNWETL